MLRCTHLKAAIFLVRVFLFANQSSSHQCSSCPHMSMCKAIFISRMLFLQVRAVSSWYVYSPKQDDKDSARHVQVNIKFCQNVGSVFLPMGSRVWIVNCRRSRSMFHIKGASFAFCLLLWIVYRGTSAFNLLTSCLCRDWPWHCRVKIDAVAKFDQYALDPVLEIVFGSLAELLDAFWRHFCEL